MFRRNPRRRSRRGIWTWINQIFYINPQKQYIIIIVSAIAMATLVFSGLLLFRQSDQGDIMTRGQWYMKQGKAAYAVTEFEKLVRNHSDSYAGHLELGKAYMEIHEPEKAVREFHLASSLRSGNLKQSGAHVAISRMMIAQHRYDDAEQQLRQAYNARRENQSDPELLSALVDLYEDWGDSYHDASPPNFEQAYAKYAQGLRYVKNEDQQTPLEDKFVETAMRLSDKFSNNKDYDKAIAVLKQALTYKRLPDIMVNIAALYEQKQDVDNAIYWDRKVYEISPGNISLKLSSLLMRKGKELNEAHQPERAEAYFSEAKKINETVKLPLDTLYPIQASDVRLSYKVNPQSFDLVPTLNATVSNGGSYPLNFLVVRTSFMSGDAKLAETDQVVATGKDPLAPRGEPRGNRFLELTPVSSIRMEDLDKGKLTARIQIRYSDNPDAKWFEIRKIEITVKESTGKPEPKSHHAA